jgi:hypothetical protein
MCSTYPSLGLTSSDRLTLQFSCSAIITLLRNIHLNPTLPNAIPDLKLVDPMLGMFCKLALRHVTAYANSSPEDGKKLEKSGIITELMRMRDFCFALRDRAKAALDMAMITTGDSNGATEVPSSFEFMRHHNNLAMQALSNSNEKPRADFVQAFETTFTKPIEATNGNSTQPNPSITHTSSTDPVLSTEAAEGQQFVDPSSHGRSGHESHINFENSMESIINHTVVDSQELAVQEETGLWNWWDLVEMDFEGYTQMV